MRRFPPAPCLSLVVRTLLVTALLTAASSPVSAQVIVGPNVNMGGGPATFDTQTLKMVGDPFLQRQNEPSLALSSRNPCHLLAGANDYRAVDVEEAAGEVGDAWLGVFKSFDCGATWTSTLMPGHKLDSSPEGLASPLKGLAAGADATVRAGTSGLFYYSGIAFNRGDGEVGKVFVARFVDNNNDDGGDPIAYLGTAEIDRGTSGQFLDKPWIVADVPRDGSTCNINGRSVPAGPVYLVYTSFVGGDNNIRSKILFSRSTDCGVTWSNPSKLSESVARNQGTTIAIDPGTGAIHIAWREFATPDSTGSRNAILVARSTDGGKSFTRAEAITPNGYQFVPFDQASSPLTFRTNAYPSIAVVPAEADGRAAGQPGRVYVAWSARGFGETRPSDARIVFSSAIGGTGWTNPKPTDSYEGAGHQIMPALAFAGGKMALAYYDLRDDAAGGFDDLVMEYGQNAFDQCMISPGASGPLGFVAVLKCVVENPSLSRRHTLDMRAAIVDAGPCLAGGTCVWSASSLLGSSKVSRYIEGRGTRGGARQQLQYNRPNLPIFSKGRFPFIGDYIDVAGQSFVSTANGGWAWNTGQTANRPAPVFHVAWADNRNVGTPRAPVGVAADWSQFTPPVLGPNSVACIPGQVGTRNQDVYTAQLRPGLIVSAPQNFKRIAGLQRSFVVVAHNTTDQDHAYVMRAAATAGVVASFDQFRGFGATTSDGDPTLPVTEIVVNIPRKSTASRTIFVGLENPPADGATAPDVLVPVEVEQLPDQWSADGFDMVFLNPDFENPDFENPDFENAELHNPDFENPDFENPDFENPDFENFTLSASSSIRNPDFENPDFENPDFENPDFENPDFENPDFENPDFENPDFENPDFENPDFENPDFENPDFENPDFENQSFDVADTTWPVRNNGNTTSAYKTNVYVDDPPDGVKFQLAVRKLYTNPAAMCTADGKPSAPMSAQSVPLVNIVGPNVQANPFDRNFNDPSRDNATFSLAPGERGIITLRAYCAESVPNCDASVLAQMQRRIALGVVAQGANCYREEDGLGDSVGGLNRCVVTDGPPKDIYDPIPPKIAVLSPTLTTPETVVEATDEDNTGFEGVTFSLLATDNVAIASVSCVAGGAPVAPAGASGDAYQFAGTFPVGTTGVTCTAFDVRGNPAPNSASVSFVVSVKDVTPPSFDLAPGVEPGSPFGPGNPAEATGPDGAVVTYTNPAATDSNGGPVTVVCESPGGLSSGSLFPIGTTNINCVATDVSGIATPETNLFDITVADRTAPVVTVTGAPSAAVEGNVLGGALVSFASSASDLVSGPVASSCTPASGTVFGVGTTTVACTATDDSGNTGSASFDVTVVDTTPPGVTVTGPTAVTVEAGAVWVDAGARATDVVSGEVTVTSLGTVNPLVPGTYTLTYAATDASGNTASATRTVTVVDTTAPVVSVTGAPTAAVEGNALGGAIVTFSSTAVDSVSGTEATSCAPASGSVFALGTTSVTCTAADDAGNTGAASFDVTVVDTTAPALTVTGATAVTVEAGAVFVDAGALAADIVAGTVAVTVSGAVNPLVPSTYTLTYTATDASGNTASATRTVTVVDTTVPVVSVTGAPTAAVEGNALGGAIVTFSSTAVDSVSGTEATSCAPASGSVFALGTTSVTCTAADDAGNTGAASFDVTVVDTTAPAVTVTGATAVTLEAGAVFVDAGALAADIVAGAAAVTVSGAVNPLVPGTYTLTYTATDASGNTASATRTVTVVDTTAPVFGSAVNVTVEATSAAGAAVTYAVPSATDAVSATVSCSPASGSTFALGTSTVNCTATDSAGNAATTSLTVTVRDTVAPALTVPANIVGVPATSAAGAVVTYTATASDAVDATPIVTCTRASGAIFAVGTTTVSCVATDATGNASAATTFTVTVIALPPTVTATATPTTLLWSPNKTMTPVTVRGTITAIGLQSATYRVVDEYGKIQPSGTITVGANGDYSFVVSLEAFRNGNDSNGRVYTITVTATDTSNRTATAQTIVTVPHNQ